MDRRLHDAGAEEGEGEWLGQRGIDRDGGDQHEAAEDGQAIEAVGAGEALHEGGEVGVVRLEPLGGTSLLTTILERMASIATSRNSVQAMKPVRAARVGVMGAPCPLSFRDAPAAPPV
ncbi:hypothetical protein MASR1M97_08510 [Candidatus Desulfobacillus denitrificans]